MHLSDILSPTLPATPTPQGISQEMDALIPPIPPAQFAATRQDSAVLLSWQGTGSDIDTHYVVYRRGSANDQWRVIGFVAVLGDNRGAYSFLDKPADPEISYSYALSTVNRYGKESSQTTIELLSSP
jgi:hypothetical protein